MRSIIIDQANTCAQDTDSLSTTVRAPFRRRLLSMQGNDEDFELDYNHKGEQINKHNATVSHTFHEAAFCPGCPFGADNGGNSDAAQNAVMAKMLAVDKQIVATLVDVVEIIERLSNNVASVGLALSATIDILSRFVSFKGSSLNYYFDRLHLQTLISSLASSALKTLGIKTFLSNVPRIIETAKYINSSELISSEPLKFYVLSREPIDINSQYGSCSNKSIAYVPSTRKKQ